MSTALQTAMAKGADKVPDKQAKTALVKAVDKIASLTRRASDAKEAVTVAGQMVVHTAEIQGTLFLASLAEGFFGKEKLKVGGLDLRAPAAVLGQGFGIYQAMSGEGGAHALSFGNGLMGSWLASVAVDAGKTLAEKRAANQAPPSNQPALPPPVLRGELAGPIREVVLTPEPSAEPPKTQRFPRARAA